MKTTSTHHHAYVIMHKNVSRETIEAIAVVSHHIEMRDETVKLEIAKAIYESGVLGRYVSEDKCIEISNALSHYPHMKVIVFDCEFWLTEVPFIE